MVTNEHMQWSKSKPTGVEVLSIERQACRIKAGAKVTVRAAGESITTRRLPDGSVEFPTRKGVHYLVTGG